MRWQHHLRDDVPDQSDLRRRRHAKQMWLHAADGRNGLRGWTELLHRA